MARDIGIDLGTANILVYMRGKGIMAKEPSVVAINKDNGQVVSVGSAAKRMIGRTPGNIVAIRPLKDGVIADYTTTSAMLKHFIHKASSKSLLSKPRVCISIPLNVTSVERRAVEEATLSSGAREVFLIEEPMASAIGSGLPVSSPTGMMVVDIGGGTTDVAVISLGGVVSAKSIKTAGDAFDRAIISYIRKKYNLIAGERTAEQIKIDIGSAYPMAEEAVSEVCGRDLITGLPKTVTITSEEIREALKECLNEILDGIHATLEITPPELSADIMTRGITVTGGGALIRGLDKFIEDEVKVPVYIGRDPLNAVANGIGEVLKNMNKLGNVLVGTKK